ncbi:hypothetical protein H9L39_19545, partial [Fusarium oxysporum f. sp. albedinis]
MKFSIVFVSCRKKDNGAGAELYTVKNGQRQPKETERMCIRQSTAEFCDTKGDNCEVIEFCSDSDLHSLVCSVGKLKWYEADCFFKQMMRSIEYIHEIGVAHLDLKPKNLLLTGDGVLKISGFGHSEDIHMISGIRGSGPYIAPEGYTDGEFAGHAVDIWACGIIYMAMITVCPLWRIAKNSKDASYARYLKERRQQEGFGPIESLPRKYHILPLGPQSIQPAYGIACIEIRMGTGDKTLQG